MQDKEFIVAGLVSECDVRFTKSGNKQWCRFTLEDFSGSHSFSLFSKDYERFMKYMQANTPLLMKCVTKQRYRKKEEQDSGPVYELSIQGMTLLSNTRDFIKEFHIELPLDQSSQELRTAFVKELKRHKGNTQLHFDLLFSHDGIDDRLQLFSTKYTVAPDYDLVGFLKKHNLRHHRVTKVEF